MDQKLRKLLRPSRGIYFFILGGFCAAALLTEQYILAGVEAAVTLLVLTGYTLSRNYRNRKSHCLHLTGSQMGSPLFPDFHELHS